MRRFMVAIASLYLASGCQQLQLKNHTVRQASTLSDIQYNQVLSNIAMFVENSNALPYFSATATGTTSIQNSLGGKVSPGWGFPSGITALFFNAVGTEISPSTQAQEQWSSNSVLNPDELVMMRSAYQRTVGAPSTMGDQALQAFFKGKLDLLVAMQPGWYCVGTKHDVPKCAVQVGRYGHTYVWVTADGIDPLTRLTLAMLDIATVQTAAIGDRTSSALEDIANLQVYAKTLSDVLHNYPDKTSQAAIKAKEQLDNVLLLLSAALAKKLKKDTAEMSVEALQAKVKRTTIRLDELRKWPLQERQMTFLGLDMRTLLNAKILDVEQNLTALTNQLNAETKGLMELSQPTLEQQGPVFRPRKNLFNPFQQPSIPMIPPNR